MSVNLVFLHGVGGSGEIWQPQTDYFNGAHKTLAWDAPGYGGREMLPEMSFATLAAQLAADMDEGGMDTAAIVGHSFGGMVAQQLAKDFPHKISHLILSGTSAAFGNPDGDFQTKFVAARTKPLDEGKSMAEVAAKVAPGLVGTSAPVEAIKLAKRCMGNVPGDTYRAVISLLTTFDLRNSLREISAPALLIAGGEDKIAPAPMMERMAQRIAGAEFTIMDGAGHLAPIEQPDRFNELVECFTS